VPWKIQSDQSSYSTNIQRIIKFELPTAFLTDTRGGYLTMNVTLSKTGGTYIRVAQWITSLFKKMEVRTKGGGQLIETLEHYNKLCAFLFTITNPTLVNSQIANLRMGYGTQAERNTQGAAAYDFVVPLFSGVFNTELLPLTNIDPIELWLTLDDATACLETDGTAPAIAITNAEFHVEQLDLEPSFAAFIKNYVNEHGLTLGFHTWTRHAQTMATANHQEIRLNQNTTSMTAIFNFFVDTATFNTTTTNDKFITWTRHNMTQWQLRNNGTIFPPQPVNATLADGIEMYHIYARYMDKWKLSGMIPIAPAISHDAFYNGSRWIFLINFEAFSDQEDDIVNPYSTVDANSQMVILMDFSAPTTAGWQLESLIQSFTKIVISRGRVAVFR
jgi:hypothetical protein